MDPLYENRQLKNFIFYFLFFFHKIYIITAAIS